MRKKLLQNCQLQFHKSETHGWSVLIVNGNLQNVSIMFKLKPYVDAAQRHIPICKDTVHRPNPVKSAVKPANNFKGLDSPQRKQSISPSRKPYQESRTDSGLQNLKLRSGGIEQYQKTKSISNNSFLERPKTAPNQPIIYPNFQNPMAVGFSSDEELEEQK